MTGAGLDTVGASQQTRAHLGDAHLRFGACVFFVAWPAITAINFSYGWPLHWIAILGIAAFLGIGVGYLAYRRGMRNSAQVQEEDRAHREAYKSKQLAEFLAEKKNQSPPSIGDAE
jgi:hypothetical protein